MCVNMMTTGSYVLGRLLGKGNFGSVHTATLSPAHPISVFCPNEGRWIPWTKEVVVKTMVAQMDERPIRREVIFYFFFILLCVFVFVCVDV